MLSWYSSALKDEENDCTPSALESRLEDVSLSVQWRPPLPLLTAITRVRISGKSSKLAPVPSYSTAIPSIVAFVNFSYVDIVRWSKLDSSAIMQFSADLPISLPVSKRFTDAKVAI